MSKFEILLSSIRNKNALVAPFYCANVGLYANAGFDNEGVSLHFYLWRSKGKAISIVQEFDL